MNKKQKRLIFSAALILFLIIAGIAGVRYLPLNRILKVASSSGSSFTQAVVKSQAPNTLFFDFEIDPKTGDKSGLRQGIAHSGQFAAKAFGKNSYSIAIDRTPAALGVEKLDAASLSSWVYIFPTKNEVNGAFVMSVNNKMGVNVFWKGIFVSGTELPMGKWFKISGLFDLSEIKWTPEDKIQVYFWNNSSCDILVDDYYIVFGAGKERRGDSAMVDMTKGQPFQPKFNTPPYPFIYLEATDIHNENSIFLVNDGKTKEGRIGTTDHVYAGKFSGAKDGLDDLLVTRANGSKECFHFSKGKGAFEKVQILGAIPLEVEKTGVIMIEKSRVASYLVKQFEPASKQFKQLFAG